MWETSYYAIAELLNQKQGLRLLLARRDQRAQQLQKLAQKASISVEQVSNEQLQRFCLQKNQGFALEYQRKKTAVSLEELQIQKDSLFVILDGVTDVGNFGAILRSCHRFGVTAVILPPRRSVSLEQLQRSSVGSSLSATIVQHNLAQSMRYLRQQGVWLYAANLKGQNLYHWRPNWPLALILGSEERGVSPLLEREADAQLSIHCAAQSDSLNVSVAAGILLYEARRLDS